MNNLELDREDLHAIGGSIIDICKQQTNSELTLLLEWIYDRTPCSYCREKAIELLEKFGTVNDDILDEYRFDALQFGKSLPA